MSATLLLANPTSVRRADGTRAVVIVQLSWLDELSGVFQGLLSDPLIILLLPYFWASNWFYTWQFNDFNLALFNPRTRALNNLLYWLSQILGAGLFGLFLDSSRLSRRARALFGWGILLVQIMAVWGGNYVLQRTYDRSTILDPGFVKMDLRDREYVGRAWLYVWNGISDACWQTYAYCAPRLGAPTLYTHCLYAGMIGAVSNNSRKLSVLVGIYKGIQSAGAAVGWRMDAQAKPYVHLFASTWALLAGGLLFALPMILLRVEVRGVFALAVSLLLIRCQDHTWAEDDVLGGIDAAGHRVAEGSRPQSVAENFSRRVHRLEDTYHRRNYPMDEFQQQHHYPLQRSKER